MSARYWQRSFWVVGAAIAALGGVACGETAPVDDPPERVEAASLALQDCSGAGQQGDVDADGVCGNVDNCPSDYNPSQTDTNTDGVGDACTSICITVQRGVSGTLADSGVRLSQPTTAYGSTTPVLAGFLGNGAGYALLKPDLSAIPATAIVTSSSLTVAVTATVQATVIAHAITAPWVESTVTWNTFGSAFDATALSSTGNASPSNNTPISFNLLSLTQAWVAGTTPNHGVLLEQPGTANTKVATGESTAPNLRPSFAVCYKIPEPPFNCASIPGTPCDDGNGCTTDSCDALTGACVNTYNSSACSDGDVCTTNDTCQAGVCVGSGQPDLDGDGVCASDNCPSDYNPSQIDSNSDGVGDVCTVVCSTAQRGVSGALADTNIRVSSPTLNFGTLNQTVVGFWSSGPAYALLRADLSSIPPSALVTSATLTVASTATAAATVNAHQITAPWSESTVTWNTFANAFAPAVTASAGNASPSNNTPVAFDLKALTQAWIKGTAANFGVLLEQPGIQSTRFATGEATSVATRPKLAVCYTVPELVTGCSVPGSNGTACDDGNACTQNDVCSSGLCVGTAVSCDDSNVCTTDSCSPATGCVHSNNTQPCDDSDACTLADVCAAGACVGSGSLSCDDGNPCTADSCNPTLACVHANIAAACSDGNACTAADTCSNGACVGAPLPDGDIDGVCDAADNCPVDYNPTQTDGNTNGIGDACDDACDTAALGAQVDTSLVAAIACNQGRLTTPNASCTSASPPSCADTLVTDVAKLAYGENNPSVAAVDTVALAAEVACQDAIGAGVRDYVTTKLQSLIGGATAAQSDAAAIPLLSPILSSCASITVAEDASGVAVPSVGAQCLAAVGNPGHAVDAVALHECLHTLLDVWVNRIGPNPKPLRPNIIFILTDDQRVDSIDSTHSFAGSDVMPGLEAELRDSGVHMTNAFVTSSLCSPSRSSILTGQYAHNHGVLMNPTHGMGGVADFQDTSTLATWLKGAGYRTGAFGKYINGYSSLWTGNTPYIPPGWDDWHVFKVANYYNYQLIENGGAVTPFGGQPSDYSTDVLRERVKTFINQSAGSATPFFMFVSFYAPHLPLVAAPRHAGSFAGLPVFRPPSYNELDVSDKPLWLQNTPLLSQAVLDNIDAERVISIEMLQAVDEAIAGSTTYGITGIMETLRANNMADNTIVIYMADNGYAWGEHRYLGKTKVYQEHHRVPMFIRYPKLVPMRRTDTRFALNIDIAPTLAELAGIVPPLPVDGESLTRVLDGTAPTWRSDFLTEGYIRPKGSEYAAVNEDGFKYVELRYNEVELYDLNADPHELNNIATDPAQASRVAAMAARLREYRPNWPNDIP